MNVHICVNVYKHFCMYMCVEVWSVYVYMCICEYVYRCICVCTVCVLVWVCMYICIHLCVSVCASTCVCIVNACVYEWMDV